MHQDIEPDYSSIAFQNHLFIRISNGVGHNILASTKKRQGL
jgi:hypothetical protein